MLNRISRDGKSLKIKHKAMAVLVRLAEANGEVVTRDEIMDAVWPGMAVTDDVLTQSIMELRRALGDDARHPSIIETIPRVGLRLIADVSQLKEIDSDSESAASHRGFPSRSLLLFASVIAALGLLYWTFQMAGQQRSPVIENQTPPSIAVLPFESLSSDDAQAYFADGITDEIISNLARIDGLRIVGRTSSFSFRGKNVDLRQAAKQLNVSHILEGSVRISGNRLRITTQLVDAEDGFELWSDTYDRDLEDIFLIQREIADSIGQALKIELTGGNSNLAHRPTTIDLEAYSWYLRGLRLTHELHEENAEDAVSAFLNAIELDPEFVPAQNGYVLVCFMIMNWGLHRKNDCYLKAELAARQALELAPDSSDSYVALAQSLLVGESRPDYRAVVDALDTALSIDPLNWQARVIYGTVLLYTIGDQAAAADHLSQAVLIEPLDLESRALLSEAYRELRQFGESEAQLKKIIELDESFAPAYLRLGSLRAYWQNDYAGGFQYYLRASEYTELPPWAVYNMLSWFLDLGDTEAAQRQLKILENRAPNGFLHLLALYRLSLFRNDTDAVSLLSQRLAAVRVIEHYNYHSDMHWLRVLFQTDHSRALAWMSSQFPELFDVDPQITLDNHAAAIRLAERLLDERESGRALKLLDSTMKFIDEFPGTYEPAPAPIFLLKGEPDLALLTLERFVHRGWRHGWWQLRVEDIYEPLWQDFRFKQLMQTVEEDMALQLDAVRQLKAF